ncbi:MAG: hypothetical protein LBE36_13465 [Flavobacteriaceae bacterium]|jgi:hypothetical protein|nr:hypothetical protein [Flavobacteriaceae bacterium]
MEKELQLVSFEQALALKKLGFDWETNHRYLNDKSIMLDVSKANWNNNPLAMENVNVIGGLSAPTVALALKWFRDVKNKMFAITIKEGYWYIGYIIDHSKQDASFIETELLNPYEFAESALLDELLEILKPEKKD